MKGKIAWLVVSCLMVLALLVASCARAEKAPAPAVKEAAPVVKEAAPVVKETTPVVKETAAAATEAPKYGGTAVCTSSPGNDRFWDPADSRNPYLLANETLLIGDWSQGLSGTGKYTFTDNYQDLPYDGSVGLLVEIWEFPDDQTIIWHIRKGIHWALDPNNAASRLVGGRELTADDIVFNTKRIYWDTKTPQYVTTGAARPLDVYATDKYTVVMKAPPGYLGLTWDNIGYQQRIMAPEISAKYGDYRDWKNNVGTGPYIVVDYVSMSSRTWKRNPNYYLTDPVGPGKGNQLPYLDGIKQLTIVDTSTRLAALRTGRVDTDTSTFLSDDGRSLIKTSPQLKYCTTQGSVPLIGLRLDGYKAGLPWAGSVPYFPPNPSVADVNALKVRRALNLAVNNQEILDTVHGGGGTVLSFKVTEMKLYEGIYTPLAQLPEESRELFEYHPDKAKQLLTEAGYPNGFKTHIVLNTDSAGSLDQAQMIKEYWRKIGVDLEIRPMTSAVYSSVQLKRTYDEIFVTGKMAYGVTKMYGCSAGNNWNSSNVNDPKLEDYYMKMAGAFRDVPKRNAIMKELNLYVIPSAYYVYMPSGVHYLFWQPWLKNYHGEVTIGSYQYTYQWMFLWLDQEMRKAIAGR